MSKKDKHMSGDNGFGDVNVGEPTSEPRKRAPRGSKPMTAIAAAQAVLAIRRRVGAENWDQVNKVVEALAQVT